MISLILPKGYILSDVWNHHQLYTNYVLCKTYVFRDNQQCVVVFNNAIIHSTTHLFSNTQLIPLNSLLTHTHIHASLISAWLTTNMNTLYECIDTTGVVKKNQDKTGTRTLAQSLPQLLTIITHYFTSLIYSHVLIHINKLGSSSTTFKSMFLELYLFIY